MIRYVQQDGVLLRPTQIHIHSGGVCCFASLIFFVCTQGGQAYERGEGNSNCSDI